MSELNDEKFDQLIATIDVSKLTDNERELFKALVDFHSYALRSCAQNYRNAVDFLQFGIEEMNIRIKKQAVTEEEKYLLTAITTMAQKAADKAETSTNELYKLEENTLPLLEKIENGSQTK